MSVVFVTLSVFGLNGQNAGFYPKLYIKNNPNLSMRQVRIVLRSITLCLITPQLREPQPQLPPLREDLPGWA